MRRQFSRPMRINTVAFENPSLRIRAVHCRAAAHPCGGIEQSATHTLVLPQSGVFVRHDSRHAAVIADAVHGVFFTAGRPYRVSHPREGGDDCLVLEYAPSALVMALQAVDPEAADRPAEPFRMPAVRLEPHTILERRILWHRLTHGLADDLEIEERAFALFSAAVGSAGAHIPSSSPWRRSARIDLVRDTQVTLASQPALRWSLHRLACRVECSPFHLARAFREHTGVSIHRYLVRARLTQSLDAILDSQRGLSSISLDAGFAHHSHFTAAFHRAFGMTPSALRRQTSTTSPERTPCPRTPRSRPIPVPGTAP